MPTFFCSLFRLYSLPSLSPPPAVPASCYTEKKNTREVGKVSAIAELGVGRLELNKTTAKKPGHLLSGQNITAKPRNVSFQKSIHVPLIAAIFYHAALFVNIIVIWNKIFNENSEISGKTFMICICRLHVDCKWTRLIFAMDFKKSL
jgi:hypothetical protein